EQVARERAMRVGYQPEVEYRVMVVVALTPVAGARDEPPETLAQRRRLLESLAELIGRRSPSAFATLRDEELVVLMPEAAEPREVGWCGVSQARALVPDWHVSVGIGGVCNGASVIARSYAQARRSLDVAGRFYPAGHGDVVVFDDLGLYRLLFHVSDPSELR